jgi:TetR/AcrR family transcriptional repressor of nem operon
MAVLSTMIGALVLSRSVNNEQLSERFLEAAANSVQRVSTATKA